MTASLEMQIFVGLAVVLGTVFVALLCDYIKGHNEQLRENNVAYRVRQQEWERFGLVQSIARLQSLASSAAAAPPQAVPETDARVWATKEELEELAGRAARIRARAEVPDEAPAKTSTTAPTTAPSVDPTPRFKLIRMDAPTAESEVAEIPDAPVDAMPEPPVALEIPSGKHDAAALDRLMASKQPFSGVAILFGATDFAIAKNNVPPEEIRAAFLELQQEIDALVRNDDFHCRYSENEFFILAPGLAGPSAQRRIFQASEKLWDFQLRSLGRLPMMFSWGGYEAESETVADAIAAVRERFEQTRNTRNTTILAVNG